MLSPVVLILLQVSFADEVAQLILERDSLAAACATAQDAAADKQQQNRYPKEHNQICKSC